MPDGENKSINSSEQFARLFTSEWLAGIANLGRRSECPSVSDLDDYASGVGGPDAGDLLRHVTRCRCCRTRLLMLDTVVVKRGGRQFWRLAHVRGLMREGFSAGKREAAAVGRFLESLASSRTEDGFPPVTGTMKGLDGSISEVQVLPVSDVSIDGHGRMLISATVLLPLNCQAGVTVCLAGEDGEIELFSTVISAPRLTAVVDLGGISETEAQIGWRSVRFSFVERRKGDCVENDLTQSLERVLRTPPIDLRSVDGVMSVYASGRLLPEASVASLAASPDQARTRQAFAEALSVLEAFVHAWAIGNCGDLPDGVCEAYLELLAELEHGDEDLGSISITCSNYATDEVRKLLMGDSGDPPV